MQCVVCRAKSRSHAMPCEVTHQCRAKSRNAVRRRAQMPCDGRAVSAQTCLYSHKYHTLRPHVPYLIAARPLCQYQTPHSIIRSAIHTLHQYRTPRREFVAHRGPVPPFLRSLSVAPYPPTPRAQGT
eukprot:1276009-Rhodomonas_salina.1